MKRGMVNDNATLSHHLLEIAQAEGIGQIPANTLGYHIDGIMQAPEGASEQRHGQVPPQKSSILSDDALMRHNLNFSVKQ